MATPRPRSIAGVPYDLFGEIPVTWPEILAWCERVAGIPADSPRLAYYVRGWNVPEKIRAAKRTGTLAAILEREPPGLPHAPELVSLADRGGNAPERLRRALHFSAVATRTPSSVPGERPGAR